MRLSCALVLALATWTWLGHTLIDAEPVGGDLDLRVAQADRAGADLLVQIAFHLIFLVEAWRWIRGLWPEIGDLIRATQVQAHETVHLIGPFRVTRQAIFGVDLMRLTRRHGAQGTSEP